MLDESRPLKFALFGGLIAINLIIMAVLFGIRLPSLLGETSAPSKKDYPGHSAYLPIVAHFVPVSVSDNSSWYVEKESGDILHIVGEVVNNTSEPVRSVQVQAELFAFRDGESLGKLRGEPYQALIPPGGKACFNLHVPKPKQFGSYQLSVLSYESAASVPEGRVLVSNAGYDSRNAWYTLNGVVSGLGASTSEEARVIGTLYELDNLVVGCDLTFVNFPVEDASQPGTFSLIMMDRDFSRVNRYEAQLSVSQQ